MGFERPDRGLYRNEDNRVALSLAVAMSRSADDALFHAFALRGDQIGHLLAARQGYCAFVVA